MILDTIKKEKSSIEEKIIAIPKGNGPRFLREREELQTELDNINNAIKNSLKFRNLLKGKKSQFFLKKEVTKDVDTMFGSYVTYRQNLIIWIIEDGLKDYGVFITQFMNKDFCSETISLGS